MKVKVIIPALNEEESIGEVLRFLPKVDEVIVVDNGSSDRTAEVARQFGATVIEEPRRGYGSACLAGLNYLRSTPPDVVAFIDADFSDDPAELPLLLDPIRGGSADFVLGSRALGNRDPGAIPGHAYWGTQFAVKVMQGLYGMRYTDLGPFRAIRWNSLERLRMRDQNFGWTVEMQAKAARHGLRVQEIPVHYRRRIGKSKISGTWWGTIRASQKILWSLILYRFVRE